MEKKEMTYKNEPGSRDLLYSDTYLGYIYYILDLGTHPTAYVQIPKDHKYYLKHYQDIEDSIYVHGGLTYSNTILNVSDTTLVKGWFIGWDYAHAGDYMSLRYNSINVDDLSGKKYTTDEIIEDCKSVIEQLRELENDCE